MRQSIGITRHIVFSTLFFVLFFCFMGFVSAVESDFEIRDGYVPGTGNPVGQVFQTEGDAFVIHEGQAYGYQLSPKLPLFMGDTIMTDKDSLVTIHLQDKSALTLGADTRMTINQSVYDPDSKSRASFLHMLFGKARFLIRKLPDFRRSEVKVKTKTAIVGVRGSDYAIEANDTITEIASFENTVLEVTSLKYPDQSVILNDFEQVRVDLNGVISDVERLIREDVERIRREFLISRPSSADVSDIGIEKSVIVPKEALVDPEDVGGSVPDDIRIPDIIEPAKKTNEIAPPAEEINQIVEFHREGVSKRREFTFPEKPY